MTEECTPLSLSELQRKAQEDIVSDIAANIYARIKRDVERYPGTKKLYLVVYSTEYNNTDCFRQIQGLLHEELSGLFPATTICIQYKPNNEWWRYALICCCPETFVSESLTINISW
jgi:hypothetical protein